MIDDDVVVGMMLSMGRTDYEVVEATRRAEGMGRVREARPDAVIVDRRFPDGDGLSVVRALRAEPSTAKLPIMVISAGYDEADRDEVEAAGADAYIAKPFDPDDVYGVLEKLIADRPPVDRSDLPPFIAPSLPPRGTVVRDAPANQPPRPAVREPLRAQPTAEEGATSGLAGRLGARAAAQPTAEEGTTRGLAGRLAAAAPMGGPMPQARTAPAVPLLPLMVTPDHGELADLRAENARLGRVIDMLESDLAGAIAAAAVPPDAEVERLQVRVAQLEAERDDARLAVSEADRLREELGNAYAEIERLEERVSDAEARSSSRKRAAPTTTTSASRRKPLG